MTVETLFGTDENTRKLKPIKFKQVKLVYESLIIREEITSYFSPNTRYTTRFYRFAQFLARDKRPRLGPRERKMKTKGLG